MIRFATTVLFVTCTTLTLVAVRATAATFQVARFDDPSGACADTNCSLRQAVIAANLTPEDDTITLAAGTYKLMLRGTDDDATAGDLDILGNVTIEGDPAGATQIFAKRAKDRAFDVRAGGALTLRHVTIRGGHTTGFGGAILSVGTLTVENSTFTGNSAGDSGGAIESDGASCTLTDVVMTKNKAGNDAGGFGFKGGGSATLRNVTISHNKSGDTGGAIDQEDGTLDIADSTLDHNKTKHEGGAFDPSGGTSTLTNVTISGNKAAQGGAMQLEDNTVVTLNQVTITANKARQGGGIWTEAGSTASLAGTLVARNKPFDCFGALDSRGSNLVGNPHGCSITGDSTGNVVGDERHPLNPLLGPLADNGGPTKTHALLAGSPARNAVAAGCPPPSTDQRGLPRAAPCDIGAFEAQ